MLHERRAIPRRPLFWIAALLAFALMGTMALLWSTTRVTPQPVIRYNVAPPAEASLDIFMRPSLTLSRDGSTLVVTAGTVGVTRLYVKTHTTLKKVPIGGGPAITLASASESRGLSWETDDTIVFSPQAVGPLVRISAAGGEARALTTIDASKGERTHRWPHALPGARAVLFTVGNLDSADNYDDATIEAVEIGSGARHVLIRGARAATYLAATRQLLFARGNTVYAAPFDVQSLQVRGEGVPVLNDVAGDTTTGAVHYAVADDGTLAYLSGSAVMATRLAWVQATGAVESIDMPTSMYMDPVISPDGTRVAVTNLAGNVSSMWVYDFSRRTFTRLTFGRDSVISPVWSRDGRRLYYVISEAGSSRTDVMQVPFDGGKEPQRIATLTPAQFTRDSAGRGSLYWISADEQTAMVAYRTLERQSDIAMLSLKDGRLTPLVATPFDEYSPQLSADGRWLAYQSNETGRYEIFVRDMTADGGRWQVSTSGGEEPHWRADGRELYFRVGDKLMVTPIALQPSFTPGVPRMVVSGVLNQLRLETNQSYTVAATGDRLLMVRGLNQDQRPRDVRVVINWFDELRKQMGK